MDLAQTPLLKTSARRFDAGVFLLALAARLAFLAVFLVKGMDVAYGRDLYYDLALTWLGWMPPAPFDATHPPLYTAFVAAVLGLFRSASPLPVLLIQCGLGALCAPLTRLLGVRLGDEKTARLAAAWVALDPGLIFFTPQLGTETLFVLMELVFFVGLFAELGRKPSPRLAGVGLWGGLLTLCRSMIGGYPAFLFLALWRTRGLAKAFLFCAVLGAGWLAPSLMWGARNYFKYDRVVPMGAQMGWTLYEGFSTDRETVRRRPADMTKEAEELGLLEDPVALGAHFAEKTKAFARAHPAEAARIVVGKAFLFWRPWPYDPHSWWQRGALGVYFTILFVLALFGVAAARSNPDWTPVWALFAYLTAVHAVFFTSLRYRMPLEPFLCLLAAMGASRLLEGRRRA